MKTLKHYLASIAHEFGREEAELMLLTVFKTSFAQRLMLFMKDPALTEAQVQQLDNLVRQRKQGVPLPYILGETYFFNLELNVNRDVLIPRPDTEILVLAALEHLQKNLSAQCLDMATGSGAVILALKTEMPELQAYGSDICEKALRVAQQNASRHSLDVPFTQSSWGDAYTENESFDVITANPPYIAYDELHLMNKETSFEPSKALFAPQNGLEPYYKLAEDAQRLLKPNGWLCVEHGFQQAEAVQQIMRNAGFTEVHSIDDIQGHPRVTQGQKSKG